MAAILLIEDSESQRTQLQEAVGRSGLFARVVEARDGPEALKVLQSDCIDIVLCDLEAPGLDETLIQMRDAACGRGQSSFIFLSASASAPRTLGPLQGDACDIISKPFDQADLIARLRLHVKINRLQDELLEKTRQLEKGSTVDCVTGLRSLNFIQEILGIEILRAQRYRTPLSILMADLDHFQRVNGLGHSAGDAVLRGAASLLRRNLRATDFPGRLGGKEFLVVLPHTPIAGALAVADSWREMVATSPVQVSEGKQVEVTVSVGAAELRPPMKTREHLVKAADDALSTAKANGCNRVAVAST
jgi:diguanylate cyclase (GGDEF)-like protein